MSELKFKNHEDGAEIFGRVDWICAHDKEADLWVGVCNDLSLTLQASSQRELHEDIWDAMETLFDVLIEEDSPIKFDKWICATWLIANAKNGISSYEIGRSIGVCQKTAWFMLQRIRLAMQNGTIEKMKGQVESDETFIGGRDRFRHKGKKHVTSGWKGKTAVQGLLERTAGGKASRVKLKVLKTTRNHEVQGNVREYVLKGSEVHTDALRSYIGMNQDYIHQVVDHAICYAKGHVHTNGLENFWCLLKRTIKGTYVNVEPFHLFRYLDEQAFRFNERENTDAGRFIKAMAGIVGKSLTFAKLTGKDETGGGLMPA